MNFFLELRRHGKLAEKRNPMYEKSKFARFWGYLMATFWIGYLIFFGTMFGFAFGGGAREAYHVMSGGFIFVLFLDVLLRIPFQKIPTQEAKPYMLLPIRRKRIFDFLLIRSGMSGFNLLWLFLFVPFSIISITRFYGVAGVVGYCVGVWLLMLVNNYWFLLCRTLTGEHIAWVALPIAVYGAVAAAMFIPDESPLFDLSMELGEGFIRWQPLAFLLVIAVIVALWGINRSLIGRLIYNELNKVEDTRVKHVSEYKFLDRYGEIGEYMRLELKLMTRNKICRSSLISVCIIVIMFSLLLSFSDVYDGEGMKNFILIYNFIIFGLLFLSTIMGYEGNYLDGLMSRKESIFSLLRAKYLVYGLGELIPFVLMIPAIVMGKLSLLACVAWPIFTVGLVYFFLFQMAVYNVSTIDLNTKVGSRKNLGTGMQNLISFGAIGVPLMLQFALTAVLEESTVHLILIVIGVGFIATSKMWIHNVYLRFMKRRYQNMEGFRASRQK